MSGRENEHVDFSIVPSSLFGFGVFVGLVDLLAIRGYWRLKPKLRRAGALQREESVGPLDQIGTDETRIRNKKIAG